MNYIFDIGNVLVDYNPVKQLTKLFSDNSLVKRLNDIIFKSSDWLMMDRGLRTRADAIDIFCAREPDIQDEIRITMNNINNIFDPISESTALLPGLIRSGHDLYYLSNMQVEIRDYLLENHEYFKLFKGGVFSCDVHFIKPSPEIYHHLLLKYDLIPGESIFFDDMKANVEAAEKEGIKGVLFSTAEDVRPYL